MQYCLNCYLNEQTENSFALNLIIYLLFNNTIVSCCVPII